MKRKDLFFAGIIAITLTIGILRFFFGDSDNVTENFDAKGNDTIVALPVILQYGIPVDSFELSSFTVNRNSNLGSILGDFNVSPYVIDQIANLAQDIFDFRRIKAGNTYKVFMKKDTSNTPSYFVYEHSPVEYIVVSLSDSIKVWSEKKETVSVVKSASGVIQSSLWGTITENNINPIVAVELSDIYAWCIDFFGIQKGDRFRVIYREQFVDSISVGVEKIEAAWFSHAGEEFYAIPFMQDSVISYYDQNGNSLKKAFLKAPLKFSRISSHFSNSRLHPVLKIRRPHHGVDYAAPVGTPVFAIGDGKVVGLGYQGGAGNLVKIKHNSIYSTAYMHLARYGQGIKAGAYVKQGQVIGYVGTTGLSTGPHLDFRFYKNGTPVDPLKVQAPPVEPVHKDNIVAYEAVKKNLATKLDAIGFLNNNNSLQLASK